MFSIWIKNEKKIFISAFAAALVFTLAVGALGSRAYSDQVSNDISSELVRFHVRANSDTDEDQRLKEHVREKVLDYLRGGLAASSSKSETCEMLYSQLSEIKDFAENVVRDKGYNYKIEAYMTRDFFPTRVYGDISLPAGEYDTLRIDIGNAAGQNWWCVLFPPLCYVDITRKETTPEEKDMLKSVLNEESYELITHTNDPQIKIKFKAVELWQSISAGLGGLGTIEPVLAHDGGADLANPGESGRPFEKSDFIGAVLDVSNKKPYIPAENGILMSVIPYSIKSDAPVKVKAIAVEAAGNDLQNLGDTEEAVAGYPERDIMLLASIINGEARGEDYTGQVAVGAVVLNRVSHPSFPDTMEEVIYQKGAFDAVRDGQINLIPSESCVRAAQEALDGSDPTDGALYYWNPKTATCRWINNIPVTIAIGNHNFGI